MEISMVVPQEINNRIRTTVWSSYATPEYIPEGIKVSIL
jgi:hypothetical protein